MYSVLRRVPFAAAIAAVLSLSPAASAISPEAAEVQLQLARLLFTDGRYLEAFAAELHRGAALVTATHDIGEAIEYDQVLLLSRRVVALGPGREVLTPDRLMETFGIVIRDPHAEHAGRFTVAERTHGGPQILDLGLLSEGDGPAPGAAADR